MFALVGVTKAIAMYCNILRIFNSVHLNFFFCKNKLLISMVFEKCVDVKSTWLYAKIASYFMTSAGYFAGLL